MFGTPTVVIATDGHGLTRPPPWQPYPPGCYGCHLSHLAAITAALADGVDRLVVFEDDAAFIPRSAGDLRLFLASAPLDAVWFGGQRLPTSPLYHRQVLRTHAYMLSYPVMLSIVSELARATGPVDFTLARLLSAVTVAFPSPMLVGQAASRSDITGLDEPARWWAGHPGC